MACQGKSTYRIGCLTFSLCEVEPPGVNLHDSCPVFQFAGFEMDTLEVKTSFRMQCRMASERLTSHRQKRSACLSVHFSACVITWCDISGFWILFVCAVCAGSSLVSYFFWISEPAMTLAVRLIVHGNQAQNGSNYLKHWQCHLATEHHKAFLPLVLVGYVASANAKQGQCNVLIVCGHLTPRRVEKCTMDLGWLRCCILLKSLEVV